MVSSIVLRGINVAAFILVVIFNALAGAGVFGASQNDVSDTYNTRITPAAYAFSIWGLIYFFQAVFIIWQILPSQENNTLIIERISWLYLALSLANILWVIVFGVGTDAAVKASSAIILLILFFLLAIYVRTSAWLRTESTVAEFILIEIAFSLYAGWVTVATIVNIAVAFVAGGNSESLGGVDASTWAVAMLWVAFVINLIVVVTRRDFVFPLVLAWAANAIRAVNEADARVEQQALAVALCAFILALIAFAYQMWYLAEKRDCACKVKSDKSNTKGKGANDNTGKPVQDNGALNLT